MIYEQMTDDQARHDRAALLLESAELADHLARLREHALRIVDSLRDIEGVLEDAVQRKDIRQTPYRRGNQIVNLNGEMYEKATDLNDIKTTLADIDTALRRRMDLEVRLSNLRS